MINALTLDRIKSAFLAISVLVVASGMGARSLRYHLEAKHSGHGWLTGSTEMLASYMCLTFCPSQTELPFLINNFCARASAVCLARMPAHGDGNLDFYLTKLPKSWYLRKQHNPRLRCKRYTVSPKTAFAQFLPALWSNSMRLKQGFPKAHLINDCVRKITPPGALEIGASWLYSFSARLKVVVRRCIPLDSIW